MGCFLGDFVYKTAKSPVFSHFAELCPGGDEWKECGANVAVPGETCLINGRFEQRYHGWLFLILPFDMVLE